MDKIAQSKRQTGRGPLNKMREIINLPGAYVEGMFKPELDRVMTALKEVDDKIRSEITGTKIGKADVPEIAKSARDLLKSARNNFNRREYMLGVADLGMFHKKIANIAKDIDKWKVDLNKIHNKFLFEGLDEKGKEQISKLREYMERKARVEAVGQIMKEAGIGSGILDFYHNFLTTRGRGLRAWEKKYPKETKALREGGSKLIDSAEGLLAEIISQLKEMATARAIRRPDDYMDAANKIKALFAKFDSGDKGFTAYYQNAILPFMQVKDQIEADEAKARAAAEAAEAAAKAKETATTTPKVELIAPVPPPSQISPTTISPSQTGAPFQGVPPLGSGFITVGPKPTGIGSGLSVINQPTAPTTEEEAPTTERKPTVLPSEAGKVAHQKFITTLESLSGEDPLILASFISKYAASIQDKDPETAISLFALARQIKR